MLEMNSAGVLLILVIVVIVVVAVAALVRPGRPPTDSHDSRWSREAEMEEQVPLLLRASKLLLVEQWLQLKEPQLMRARVDEVYRQPSGELLVVDTKSREQLRVYRKDIVELSVYAYILRQMGHVVAPFGYLRLRRPRRVDYVKVSLLSEHWLMGLIERARELDQGLRPPNACARTIKCRGCDMREHCTQGREI